MKISAISLILCIILISCASSNSYMKKYKNCSCDQIEKAGDKILNDLGQNKSHFGDKVLDGVAITFDIMFIAAGGLPGIPLEKSSVCKGVHRTNLKNAHKALEDLAIEKNCPSKPYILQMRELILRSPDVDGRIDSR